MLKDQETYRQMLKKDINQKESKQTESTQKESKQAFFDRILQDRNPAKPQTRLGAAMRAAWAAQQVQDAEQIDATQKLPDDGRVTNTNADSGREM